MPGRHRQRQPGHGYLLPFDRDAIATAKALEEEDGISLSQFEQLSVRRRRHHRRQGFPAMIGDGRTGLSQLGVERSVGPIDIE